MMSHGLEILGFSSKTVKLYFEPYYQFETKTDQNVKIMNNMKLAIIGSGPAGITFYEKVVGSHVVALDSVSIFDPDGKICPQQIVHNLYVENVKSKCPEQLKFLVDGTKLGPELQKYFHLCKFLRPWLRSMS
jgi:hypothetical protein